MRQYWLLQYILLVISVIIKKKTAGKIEIIRLKIRKRTATDSSCRGEVKISFSAKRDFSLSKVHKHSFEVLIMRHTIYQYQYYLIINTVVRYRCGFFFLYRYNAPKKRVQSLLWRTFFHIKIKSHTLFTSKGEKSQQV